MEDLPVVVLKVVFDFLSIREKFAMKLTCKKWKFVADTMCRQQNVCIYSIKCPYNERWCFSEQKVAEEDMIYIKFNHTSERKFDLKLDFFKNLQKLYLYSIGEKINEFLLELNQLTKLEVLMIDDYVVEEPKLRKLSSTSLQKLSIRDINCQGMELDTPNLSALVLYCNRRKHTHVLIRFPLKIKHLECKEFTLRLSSLKNLETLACYAITFDLKLRDYKRLAKLEIFPINEDELQFVRSLQEERTRLGRDALEIIVSGFKERPVIFDHGPFLPANGSRHYQLTPAFLEHVAQNDFVGRVPLRSNMSPLTLLKYGPSIPRDFFDRLAIDHITIDSYRERDQSKLTKKEQSNLIELIKQIQPEALRLPYFNVDCEFYEQISCVQSIKYLVTRNVRKPGSEKVEFDHFKKLRNLVTWQMNVYGERIPLDVLSKLFVEFKFLLYFNLLIYAGSEFKAQLTVEYYVSNAAINNVAEDEEDVARMRTSPYFINFSGKNLIVHLNQCKDAHEVAQEIEELRQYELSKNCFIY